MSPTVLDLFSGCGGFSLGFQQAGYDIVAFVEMWKPAIETYKLNHPNAKHLGYDITKVKDEELLEYRNKIDVIIGGPPCQGFSLAGKRNKEDNRNQLYKEYLRFVEIINPKTIVMENVQGILTMRDKDNEKIINKILKDLIRLEYLVTFKKIKAINYGIPQNRERILIIGKKCNMFNETINECKTVIETISDLPYEENGINGHLHFKPTEKTLEKIKNLKQGERLLNYNLSRRRIFADKPSPTIVTKPIYIHPYYNRLLTPRELARIQSFPDEFIFTGSKTSMVKQIGNAVPPKLAKEIANDLFKDNIL